ncbi:multidrug ABC transporter ATPase [Oceanobacillus longus]|uniref:Multidrug ABC transporter ATPase n=1 Tax=Oceanobacillus longus TaxID=930120 RepID=A0ABV8H0K9_9BACI
MTNGQFNLINSNSNNRDANSSSNNEITVAKLAVLGGLLATIGDGISTLAAVLALEELQQTQNNSNNNNDRISELEKQIKYLTKEINQQKNMRR